VARARVLHVPLGGFQKIAVLRLSSLGDVVLTLPVVHALARAYPGAKLTYWVKEEFAEHATQEQEHADRIAERIVQLGGEPDLNPDTLTSRSHAEYVEGSSLVEMLREDLIAERIAIDSYREIAEWLHGKDPTTKRLMEEILAVEEEHADDINSLLAGMKD